MRCIDTALSVGLSFLEGVFPGQGARLIMTLGGAATMMSEVLEKNSDQIRNYLYDAQEFKMPEKSKAPIASNIIYKLTKMSVEIKIELLSNLIERQYNFDAQREVRLQWMRDKLLQNQY